jgi:hypothetical protein
MRKRHIDALKWVAALTLIIVAVIGALDHTLNHS